MYCSTLVDDDDGDEVNDDELGRRGRAYFCIMMARRGDEYNEEINDWR
jgi:hypothetical protein